MTTANIAQTNIEAIGANPNAAGQAAQVISEAIGANPNVPAQVFIEVVASTLVPPYRGLPPELRFQSDI